MKESEKLTLLAQEANNDFKALNLHTKALRERRLERFDEYITPLREKGNIVSDFNGQKVVIETKEKGIIDFFPKANKVFLRDKKRWVKPGLKWLITNLINNHEQK